MNYIEKKVFFAPLEFATVNRIYKCVDEDLIAFSNLTKVYTADSVYRHIKKFDSNISLLLLELKGITFHYDEPYIMASNKVIQHLNLLIDQLVIEILKCRNVNGDVENENCTFLRREFLFQSVAQDSKSRANYFSAQIDLFFSSNQSFTTSVSPESFPISSLLSLLQPFESNVYTLKNKLNLIDKLLSFSSGNFEEELEKIDAFKNWKRDTLTKNIFSEYRSKNEDCLTRDEVIVQMGMEWRFSNITNEIENFLEAGFDFLYSSGNPEYALSSGFDIATKFKSDFNRLVNYNLYDVVKFNFKERTPYFVKQYRDCMAFIFLKLTYYEFSFYKNKLLTLNTVVKSSEFKQRKRRLQEASIELTDMKVSGNWLLNYKNLTLKEIEEISHLLNRKTSFFNKLF